ncbi:hypothetical protein GCM10025857_10750 [Alicyclobacillus contaminans]|uniref:hypothetical protein n=1 Tax=Alicyclobacillus contaminans TaxID=392016 RepID=UPI0004799823|nr:hypothetical protein [Alicyclobacillus contaminans]GMA49718.1 hypothetical protein GCM10025857_10750 [Alicyclobacillus contaminans]
MKIAKVVSTLAVGALSTATSALTVHALAYGTSGSWGSGGVTGVGNPIKSGAYGTYAIIDNDTSSYSEGETGGSHFGTSPSYVTSYWGDQRITTDSGYKGDYWNYYAVDKGVWNSYYYLWVYNADQTVDSTDVHYFINNNYVGQVNQHLLYEKWVIPSDSGVQGYVYTTGSGSVNVKVEGYDYNPADNIYSVSTVADAIQLNQSGSQPE